MQTQERYTVGKKTYTISPFSAVFPPMADEEYAQFRDHIKANGLSDPVIYADPRNGQIIEGRHRLHAVAEINDDDLSDSLVVMPAPIPPPVMDDSIREFVLAKNMHRRHMTTGQRAMVAATLSNIDYNTTLTNLAKLARGESVDGGTTVTQAAEVMAVSPRAVKQGRRIRRHPDLEKAVMSRQMTLNAADTEASEREGGTKGKNGPTAQRTATPKPLPQEAPPAHGTDDLLNVLAESRGKAQEPLQLSDVVDSVLSHAANPPAIVPDGTALPVGGPTTVTFTPTLKEILAYIRAVERFTDANQLLAAAQEAVRRTTPKAKPALAADDEFIVGSEGGLLGEMLD